jgi:hypothetical protein
MGERAHVVDDRNVRTVLAPMPPDRWYSGRDSAERVRIDLDGAARNVTVALEDGWRAAVGTAGLAPAVLQAFSAATSARLAAWAAAPGAAITSPLPDDQERGPAWPTSRQLTSDSLSRAWRDLREFRLRLEALHEAGETVSSPGGLVIVTIARGQLVGVDLDSDWLRTATSRDIERHVGLALRDALALIATLPERALEGCPDLAALVAGSSFSPWGSSRSGS